MTIQLKDGLFTFGSNEIVEVPPDLSVGGGIANTNDAVQKAPLGTLLRFKGQVYRYVKVDAVSVAAAANGVVYWHELDLSDEGKFEVCTAYALRMGATNGWNLIAGILGCAVTHGHYTWIQVGGVADCLVDRATDVGDLMIYSTTDLTFGRDAADANSTAIPFGVALEEDLAGVAAVLLHNMMTF
jgi:hypothetical protein